MAYRSGLESGNALRPDFYREDELKYHGRSDRGVISNLNFAGDQEVRAVGEAANSKLDFCGGMWTYPRTCE